MYKDKCSHKYHNLLAIEFISPEAGMCKFVIILAILINDR